MLGLTGSYLSKEFFDLAKSIGETRSKQEEDRIICNEIILLKSRFSEPNSSVKQIKEYLIRAIYIEMLGHDASFAYIHAVKLAHEKNILCKRTGYLACNLFLNKDHELMLLLINTIQKDLKSDNHLEIWAALNCVCKLLNNEMIPAIFPIITNLLNHKNELIRKKVCMLLHKMYLIDPSLIKEIDNYLKKLLCDVDPSVMGASLNLIHCIAKSDMTYCIKLVPYLVSILKQITENKLPRDYDYHRIPAPWIQIKILSIFRILGFSNKKLSEQMYEVLQKTMHRADFGINVGYAIIYECVKTITTIYPSHHLLELASLSISRFISSDNHNLKYVGVTGLALIVKINPMYASEHQLAVVDCLEDKDETLKMKTLDLLYQMTNPLNVQVIVDKLLFYMNNSLDIHFKHDLACKIIQLIERYTPDDVWFLNKINSVFLSVGELLDENYSYSLIKLLKDSSICLDSDSGDEIIRNEINNENNNSNNVNIENLNIEDIENKDILNTEKGLYDMNNNNSNGELNNINYDINDINSIKRDNINDIKDDVINNEDNEINNERNYIKSENNKNIENNNNSYEYEKSNNDLHKKELKEKKKINDDIDNLRKYAVNTYIRLLENNENIPFILMQIICWILGEYSYLCDLENYTAEDIIDLLCECLEKNFNNTDRVKSCIITAIFKLCCCNNITDHVVANKLIEKYKNSQQTDMQQRCYEFDLILNNPTLMKNLFSVKSKQNIVIDENLSFLNPFIEKHLKNGGKTYITKDLRKNESQFETSKNTIPELNFTPYEVPINDNFHLDNLNTCNNSAYEKGYHYDSSVNISANDNFSNIKEKEKPFKLNVVGPKKWKKKTERDEEKKKNENNYNEYNGIIDSKIKLEKIEIEKKIRKSTNIEDDEENYYNNYNEEDYGEEKEEEGEDGDNYSKEEIEIENEKKMDSIEDYSDKNYERFDENIINHLKEYEYHNDNHNNNIYNKRRNPFRLKKKNANNVVQNHELTEKEKMAAALFNGLISNNSSESNLRNNYVSNFSDKKGVAVLSNRNYFNGKYNNQGIVKKTYFTEKYLEKIQSKDDTVHQNEKVKNSSGLMNNNLISSSKPSEIKRKTMSFDMLDLNESSENIDQIQGSKANIEEDKKQWNYINIQKKAIFLNTVKLNIFQAIKAVEDNLKAKIVEVSEKEAFVSCFYHKHKVLIKIKIDNNKLIFLVKSVENNVIDNVLDNLRNLFHA
ncbi:AP-4 complex subunit epsilon, putative [Plasmodium relictum]|uniref:AP-4 complex subunit epsilon, putative n=1 Tax=Plasmodium relictum TaxID=85471 RepID=A0A1J1H3B9_PLARL|nr:AP-4 complex subunit epsilon, putative [Plasmodium relictum]CRG99248.1 AP-4 complex subunit epsilon, putative [Plasmodium relictum]